MNTENSFDTSSERQEQGIEFFLQPRNILVVGFATPTPST